MRRNGIGRAAGVAAPVVVAVMALWCSPALAHGTISDQKSLWIGALHVVTSPLSLAALVGLILSTSGAKDPWPMVLATLAGLGTAAAALYVAFPGLAGLLPYWTTHAALVLLGLVAASGVRPQGVPGMVFAGLLALCGGLAAGQAADMDVPSWAGAAGAGLTIGFGLFLGMTALDDLEKATRLRAITVLARRIMGSWVSAIGLLMGALAIKMHHG